MGKEQPKLIRVVKFYLLSSLPDACLPLWDVGAMLSMSLSVSDLCASDAQCQPKSSRDSLELRPFQGREAPFDPRGEPSLLYITLYITGGIWAQS